MRIWLVQTGEEMPFDGADTRLLRTALLANELASRGHQVTFINATFNHQRKHQRFAESHFLAADPSSGLAYDCLLLKGRAYRSNVSLDRFLSHRENAASFLKSVEGLPKPDIILCGFPPIELADAATQFARRHNIPCVVDCRDMWPEVIEERFPSVVRPIARLALMPLYYQKQRALANANALTGISDAFVNWGAKGAKRARRPDDRPFHLAVSPTEIGQDALDSGNRSWDGLIGADNQDRFLTGCFVGTFAARLDILSVIDGVNLLTDPERQRVRIVLCGKGDLEKEIAERSAGNPAIILAGWRNAAEIASLLSRSDFGVLPYPNTPDFLASYPNKVGEFLMAGLPIMTGLLGETGRLLDEHCVALRYEPRDPTSIANLLRELLQTSVPPDQRRRASALGASHFNPRQIYPAFADYLEEISARPRRKEAA